MTNLKNDVKVGKRLAGEQVLKLRRVILLDVVGYVNYTDEVQELFDDLDLEMSNKSNEVIKTGLKLLEGENEDYLLTWTTNAYVDREGEAFKLDSLKEFVKECEKRDDKGVYQFWHIPGSEFADVVALTTSGKFLVEIGKFRKDEIGRAFKKFFLQFPDGHPAIAPNGWGCSHGFVYKASDRQDKVYEWFDKKETTILPLEKAANIFTLMEMLS